jgi:restriction system protein
MKTTQKKTIIKAISKVLKAEGKPMSAAEIYDAINSSKLYTFKADKPVHVVSTQIRRHCNGLDFSSSSKTKYFGIKNGKYYLLNKVITVGDDDSKNVIIPDEKKLSSVSENDLKNFHAQYLRELKQRILDDIKELNPYSFEKFCKVLLSAYGFDNLVVTKKSRDGGIDGHGIFKGGLLDILNINVGFQCKKRKNDKIVSSDIDKFRGTLRPDYEVGIFFTTTDFTFDAKKNAVKEGASPVFLINGEVIVNIMLEKRLGIEAENITIYNYNLELAFDDSDEN